MWTISCKREIIGNNIDKLKKFKKESEGVLESAKLPIHKWESNITSLEDENMQNPSKMLGHACLGQA
jgi:hypothetical protein